MEQISWELSSELYNNLRLMLFKIYILFCLLPVNLKKKHLSTGECSEEMRKVGTIENNQIVYSSSSVESSEIDGSVAWSPETGDTKPHVLINFPTKARVIAIKVQGGPDGYIEKFQIGFKETPEEFQYIKDTNHKIVVRYY